MPEGCKRRLCFSTIYRWKLHALNVASRVKETVKWLKAESQKCPFCGTLIDTTEFRRGIDEATNRTREMLQNLQDSLGSIKIKIQL